MILFFEEFLEIGFLFSGGVVRWEGIIFLIGLWYFIEFVFII